MNKIYLGMIAACVVMLFSIIVISVWSISVLNHEAKLRVLIEAKQKDNESEFDNMWKKIKQVAQIPEEKKNALKEIFVSYSESRSKINAGGKNLMMSWVKESVPSVDLKIYDQLANIITASRDSWTMRQKELIGLKSEHDYMFENIPQCWVVASREDKRPHIVIITSDKSKEAIKTGSDNDVDLFKK